MKILIYASVLLIYFCGILSTAVSVAHGGLPIMTQWEAEGANVFENESAFVHTPSRVGEVLGGISGGAAGIIIGLPVGALATLVYREPVHLLLFPAAGNLFMGYQSGYSNQAVSAHQKTGFN